MLKEEIGQCKKDYEQLEARSNQWEQDSRKFENLFIDAQEAGEENFDAIALWKSKYEEDHQKLVESEEKCKNLELELVESQNACKGLSFDLEQVTAKLACVEKELTAKQASYQDLIKSFTECRMDNKRKQKTIDKLEGKNNDLEQELIDEKHNVSDW